MIPYFRRPWRLAFVLLAFCLGGVLPDRARAQQPPVPGQTGDLQWRVRELEEKLRRLEAELDQKADADRPAVQGAAIVGDALKAQEEKTKKDEEEKKTEAEKKNKEEAKGTAVGGDLTFKATWKEGLLFETPSKDFRVHVGGRFDADWAWFGAPSELQTGRGGVGKLEDGAEFRRARIRFDGTAYEVIDFLFEVDFAPAFEGLANHSSLTDVYFDITQMPVIGNFRAGHFREPFGMEALTSGNALTFLERSNNWETFEPFRNMGMMLYNTVLDDRASWAAGFFRTNSRNNGNPFDYGDGEYAGTGRVTFLPWYENEGRCLLHLGAAYSHRGFSLDPGQDPVRYRSFPGIRVGRYIFADTGNIPAQSTDLANAELGLNLGPFCLQGEYFHTWVHEALIDGTVRSPSFHGWYAQVSYFLTGENRTYRRYIGQRTVGVFDRPRVNENFWFVSRGEGHNGWRDWSFGRGAWEVALRYSFVDLNDPEQGVPAQTLQDVTVGLNWYLNNNTKIQWNYIVADRHFPSKGNEGLAHIFAMRFHYDF